MSEDNNDIRKLLEDIREGSAESENERYWTAGDIDELLHRTARNTDESTPKKSPAEDFDEYKKYDIPENETVILPSPDSDPEDEASLFSDEDEEDDEENITVVPPRKNSSLQETKTTDISMSQAAGSDESLSRILNGSRTESKKSGPDSSKGKFSSFMNSVSGLFRKDSSGEEKPFATDDEDDEDGFDEYSLDGEETEKVREYTVRMDDEKKKPEEIDEEPHQETFREFEEEKTRHIDFVPKKVKSYGNPNARTHELSYDTINEQNEKKAQEERFFEKSGIIIKKGQRSSYTDLEGAPTIMTARTALEEEPPEALKVPDIPRRRSGDFQEQIRSEEESGQLVLEGFDVTVERPKEVDEYQTEQELFEKRKEKIRNFSLFSEDEKNDPYGTDPEKEKLGELFEGSDEKPKKKPAKAFTGLEYSQPKDTRRVRRYLISQKKKSFSRIVSQATLLVIAIIVSITAASGTTVAGDKFLTILTNFILITISILAANHTVIDGFQKIAERKVNMNTAVSLAAILCFIQNTVMLILYFLNINLVSVFSGAGIVPLLFAEIHSYLMYSRTEDALELCTEENRDRLYSIEGIYDDKDIAELGKYTGKNGTRIRYSCKTRFPSHLLELCTGETSADTKMKIILPVAAVLSLVNLIAAWIVNGHFSVAFAAFTGTFALSVPFYASVLAELPLYWVNRQFNPLGGMISCQETVNELAGTNTVIIDSRDLFDQKRCSLRGFKDFRNVRIDDAMLYSAAMVVRSGGPLTGAFDQVVVNRRDILPSVKSFSYEDKLGVSGWIYNQKVLLGSKTFMINHNIEIPEDVDEEKFLSAGCEVMYLAIAHKPAAMMVVEYKANRRLTPYLRRLRDSGVNILVRNCDPNVTEKMISDCFRLKLNNIKILSTGAGRIFKKYKSRPKISTRALCIHDGTFYTFIRSLCNVSVLRHSFRTADILTVTGVITGFAVMLTLSLLNVIADLPLIFVILTELVTAAVFTGIIRLTCSR